LITSDLGIFYIPFEFIDIVMLYTNRNKSGNVSGYSISIFFGLKKHPH